MWLSRGTTTQKGASIIDPDGVGPAIGFLRVPERTKMEQSPSPRLLHHRPRPGHLGPGAGQAGRAVFTGTPTDLVAHGKSLTARHLRAYVDGTSDRFRR